MSRHWTKFCSWILDFFAGVRRHLVDWINFCILTEYLAMSTTSGRPIVRPTLQTVPESLPADHVTQPAQTPVAPSVTPPAVGVTAEKNHSTTTTTSNQCTTPAVSLKPRSTSSRVSRLVSIANEAVCAIRLLKFVSDRNLNVLIDQFCYLLFIVNVWLICVSRCFMWQMCARWVRRVLIKASTVRLKLKTIFWRIKNNFLSGQVWDWFGR